MEIPSFIPNSPYITHNPFINGLSNAATPTGSATNPALIRMPPFTHTTIPNQFSINSATQFGLPTYTPETSPHTSGFNNINFQFASPEKCQPSPLYFTDYLNGATTNANNFTTNCNTTTTNNNQTDNTNNNNNNGLLPKMQPNKTLPNGCMNKVNNDVNNTVQNELMLSLTQLKLLMTGKEVGSIIGKKGENIKLIREESGAKIYVSDGNTAERIATVSGSLEQMKACIELICRKIENLDDSTEPTPPTSSSSSSVNNMAIRLLLSQQQYLCILGDGGEKFKRLKESANVTLLIGADFYTNSTEKLFTVSGNAEAVSVCIAELNKIFQEMSSIITEAIIPFQINPSTQNNGTAISLIPLQNFYAPTPALVSGEPLNYPITPIMPFKFNPILVNNTGATNMPLLNTPTSQHYHGNYLHNRSNSLVPTTSSTNGNLSHTSGHPQKLHHHHHQQQQQQQQLVYREFYVYNDVIGCVIGRGGATINEIRNISGAQIKISNCEEGKPERRITITGNMEAVQSAQLLINSSIEAFKQAGNVNSLSSQPLTSLIMAQLKNKKALSTLTSSHIPLTTHNTTTVPCAPSNNSLYTYLPTQTHHNISAPQQLIHHNPVNITQNIVQLSALNNTNTIDNVYSNNNDAINLHDLHAYHNPSIDTTMLPVITQASSTTTTDDTNVNSNISGKSPICINSSLKMKPTLVNLDGSIRYNTNALYKYKPY